MIRTFTSVFTVLHVVKSKVTMSCLVGDAILPEGPTESYSRRGSSSELNIHWRDGQFQRHLSPGKECACCCQGGSHRSGGEQGWGHPRLILPFPDGEAGWSLADRGGAISAVIFIFEQAGSLLLYPTRREELSGESDTESESLWRGDRGKHQD